MNLIKSVHSIFLGLHTHTHTPTCLFKTLFCLRFNSIKGKFIYIIMSFSRATQSLLFYMFNIIIINVSNVFNSSILTHTKNCTTGFYCVFSTYISLEVSYHTFLVEAPNKKQKNEEIFGKSKYINTRAIPSSTQVIQV